MSDEDLIFEVDGPVAVITLNRPAKRNAITEEMGERLAECLQRIRSDDAIHAAIITGAGGAFSAGADLKQRAASGGVRAKDQSPATIIDARLAPDWSRVPMEKPLIAAIDGYCLAGGMELALICDIRICSPAAQFGLPEITRGFFAGGGGPQRLARAIPQSLAMEIILTGDRIDAEAALRSGLVSRVVAADALMDTAKQIAGRIAGHAPLAVRAAKETAEAALDQPLDEALRLGQTLRWIIGQTDDAKEGPRAFAEKREPKYRGS